MFTVLLGLFLLFMLIDLLPSWCLLFFRSLLYWSVAYCGWEGRRRGGGKILWSLPNITICMLHHTHTNSYIYIYGWVGSHKKVTTDQLRRGRGGVKERGGRRKGEGIGCYGTKVKALFYRRSVAFKTIFCSF